MRGMWNRECRVRGHACIPLMPLLPLIPSPLHSPLASRPPHHPRRRTRRALRARGGPRRAEREQGRDRGGAALRRGEFAVAAGGGAGAPAGAPRPAHDRRRRAGDQRPALPHPGTQPRGRARTPGRLHRGRPEGTQGTHSDPADPGLETALAGRQARTQYDQARPHRPELGLSHRHRMRDAADDIVLPLPSNAPRVDPNRFTRWLGRTILRLGGWRMEGAFPDIPKLVLIGAPHSSNWDGVWGMAAKLALGLDIRILGKHQLFWWPLSVLLRRLGIIAVNRDAAQGVTDQAAAMIREADRFWFGLAPEGTRKPVLRFKPGFWKIARAAGVPVLPAYFDYPRKIIGIGPLLEMGADMDAEIARVQRWYAPWHGRRRNVAQPPPEA